jgi:hypothetical protein
MRRSHLFVCVLAIAVVAITFGADPALAGQTTTSTGTDPAAAGNAIKDMLLGVAKPLLLGLVGIMALNGIVRHDFGRTLTVLAIGMAAGIPIFAPQAVQATFSNIANMIVGHS